MVSGFRPDVRRAPQGPCAPSPPRAWHGVSVFWFRVVGFRFRFSGYGVSVSAGMGFRFRFSGFGFLVGFQVVGFHHLIERAKSLDVASAGSNRTSVDATWPRQAKS